MLYVIPSKRRSTGFAALLRGSPFGKSQPSAAVADKISATTDPEEIFLSKDVDAVIVATSTATHVDLTLRAINAGKVSKGLPGLIQ